MMISKRIKKTVTKLQMLYSLIIRQLARNFSVTFFRKVTKVTKVT